MNIQIVKSGYLLFLLLEYSLLHTVKAYMLPHRIPVLQVPYWYLEKESFVEAVEQVRQKSDRSCR